MSSLLISSSCEEYLVTNIGRASASMSLPSVSPITGKGVPSSSHTRPDGCSNDGCPGLRQLMEIYFSAMSVPAAQCPVGHGPALLQYLAVFDMATVLPLVGP